MNVAGEKGPDDEGPDLFGVPAPIATPGALGPNGSGNESEGPEDEADDVETTSFGSGGKRTRVGGLQSGTVSFDFHQDFGSGAIDDDIFPLLGGTPAIEVIPTAGTAVSATNPKYSFNCLVTEYSPLDSAVGDLATFSVSWPISGAVTRGTTA
jgi:hypothetical protein